MTPLNIVLDGDNCWPELKEKGFTVAVARLPLSTNEGRSTVAFRVELPDGRTVIAEPTLRLIQAAVKAIEAREEMEARNVAHN
jgi:hypothetical protein